MNLFKTISILVAVFAQFGCATTRDLSPEKIGSNERLVFGRFVHDYDYPGDRPYEYFTYRVGDLAKGFLNPEFPRATIDSYDHFFWLTVPREAKKMTIQKIAVGLNGFQVNLAKGEDGSVAEVSLPESKNPVYVGDLIVTTEKRKLEEPLIGGPGGYTFYGIFIKGMKIESNPHSAQRYLGIRGLKGAGFSTALFKLKPMPGLERGKHQTH
jgi:hypothetical protein